MRRMRRKGELLLQGLDVDAMNQVGIKVLAEELASFLVFQVVLGRGRGNRVEDGKGGIDVELRNSQFSSPFPQFEFRNVPHERSGQCGRLHCRTEGHLIRQVILRFFVLFDRSRRVSNISIFVLFFFLHQDLGHCFL